MNKPLHLETDRLVLREWLPSDEAAMCAINSDLKVMEHFPALLSEAETRELINKFKLHFGKYGYGFYALEVKPTSCFIGFAGLHNVAFDADFTPAVEIGWRLSSKHWGKGYATEAAKAAVNFAFNELKLKEIVAFTTINNKKSRRVMEKLGMTHHSKDDFDHPRLPADSPLRRHVLYRLAQDL